MAEAEKKNPFNWAPLESDPTIFTNYFQKLGLSDGWGFQEVFGLDPDLIAMCPGPIKSMILVFERLQPKEKNVTNKGEAKFFMSQTSVLDNACGLIAAIHGIGNNLDSVSVTEGSTLAKLYSKMNEVTTPGEKALALEGFEELQAVHNEHAMTGQSDHCQNQADVKHHYVAFVLNGDGDLIELDGVKDAPTKHASGISADDFGGEVGKVIMKMVEEKKVSESMSLMALVKS